MSAARRDFEEFVRWLHQREIAAAPNVRQMANLILSNFEDIAATSLQRSQRAVLITDLAQRAFATTSEALPDIAQAPEQGEWPWKRLHHLSVGPFRGFRRAEPFNLNKAVILFYGPNGSGKTSFCEALEYSLLGSVGEAQAMRIPDATYLSNFHEERYEPPVLTAIDQGNNQVPVIANADIYRFCFVEKNRIDSFSRLASKTNAQRTELIATLFGMERFNDFVRNFNESLDQQLNLFGIKGAQLAQRRAALEQDQLLIGTQKARTNELVEEERVLANSYAEGMTYLELNKLISNNEEPCRLDILNGVLNVIPSQILNVTAQGLHANYVELDAAHAAEIDLRARLQERSAQVSFKDLYSAVIALQPTEGERCPACETPLLGQPHTLRNPYEKAATGLQELGELTILQTNHGQAIDRANQAAANLKRLFGILLQFVTSNQEQESIVGQYLSGAQEENSECWWTRIYDPEVAARNNLPTHQDLYNVCQLIEAQDIQSRISHAEHARNIEERDRLINFRLKIQDQDRKRELLSEMVIAAQRRINSFENENAGLISQVAQEVANIRRDSPIKTAYDQFLTQLRHYKDQLPGTLMEGLNDKAMALYNEFNRDDLNEDKLESLYLPVTGDQRIDIVFRGKPQTRVDALKVLSEGHIRCMGLAILLAKNINLNSPLLVFDDAINAIDHDHRRGIRSTIFESENFENTQILVTCHSNEWLKDIQDYLPQRLRNDSLYYLFRHHTGDYHPRVNGHLTSRNYVELARAANEEMNERGVLDASRKAIEMFTEKIWRWLGRNGLGTITLPLAGVGAEPALRNKVEALRKKIDGSEEFVHENNRVILDAFGKLIGVPERNLIWQYLNKGTHEEADRDDFDRHYVQEVLDALEELDALNL